VIRGLRRQSPDKEGAASIDVAITRKRNKSRRSSKKRTCSCTTIWCASRPYESDVMTDRTTSKLVTLRRSFLVPGIRLPLVRGAAPFASRLAQVANIHPVELDAVAAKDAEPPPAVVRDAAGAFGTDFARAQASSAQQAKFTMGDWLSFNREDLSGWPWRSAALSFSAC
jgi:hypothetical protein